MGYIFDAINQPEPDRPGEPAALPPTGDGPPPPDAPDAQDGPPESLSIGAPPPDENGPPTPLDADILGVDDRLVALTEPQGLMAEEYRAIRTGLLARWKQQRHIVHTITSATPQEGKTLTSLNLGLSFAELRTRRTIVVEADLRIPQFQNLLGLPESDGLVPLLEGECELNSAIQRVRSSRLDIIPAGRRANDRAVQLLSGAGLAELVKKLRQQYDHVIIDTPPVVELADAGIVGALSDDVVLIARMNRTPRPLIEQAIRILSSYNAPVAGVIGTDYRQPRRRKLYRYGYGYGYRYYNSYAQAA